jgi:hypothetical protein
MGRDNTRTLHMGYTWPPSGESYSSHKKRSASRGENQIARRSGEIRLRKAIFRVRAVISRVLG